MLPDVLVKGIVMILEKEIPEVDAWFGTMEMPLLLKKLNADYKAELVGERLLSTPQHYAYLKISEGCNRTCSFCAIPLMRGVHVSRPIEELVKEAENLVRMGVKELMLIAQELTYYGLDIYKKRQLPELLNRLADVKGLEWIRLSLCISKSKFPLEILDTDDVNVKISAIIWICLCNTQATNAKGYETTNYPFRNVMNSFILFGEKFPEYVSEQPLIVGFPGEKKIGHCEHEGFSD